MELQAGQNVALEGKDFAAEIVVSGALPGMELDVSAFVLDESGRVRGDDGFVFYGQPSYSGGAVHVEPSQRRISFLLDRLPAYVERIAIAITIDRGLSRGQRFSQLQQLALRVRGHTGQALDFVPATSGMGETALILGEVYLRNGQWKLRAVGQGFNGGLGPLARHFGVDVADDPDAAATPAATPPPPIPAPAAVPPPVAAPPVNLSKIVLEKSRPVALEKASGRFGEIVVNLRWSRGNTGLFSRGIDLDLGAMVELRDGRKAVVQALGRTFGDLAGPPYVRLMGDDRTGSSGQGEFLHINGDHWQEVARVLIFAFIYQGVPNWSKADASVSIRALGQPELEARLDSPNERDGMCAIAMLENRGGALSATKHVEYFAAHDSMDARFGFGFQWRAGSK